MTGDRRAALESRLQAISADLDALAVQESRLRAELLTVVADLAGLEPDGETIGTKQAAHVLGCSERHAIRLADSMALGFRKGGRVLFWRDRCERMRGRVRDMSEPCPIMSDENDARTGES